MRHVTQFEPSKSRVLLKLFTLLFACHLEWLCPTAVSVAVDEGLDKRSGALRQERHEAREACWCRRGPQTPVRDSLCSGSLAGCMCSQLTRLPCVHLDRTREASVVGPVSSLLCVRSDKHRDELAAPRQGQAAVAGLWAEALVSWPCRAPGGRCSFLQAGSPASDPERSD